MLLLVAFACSGGSDLKELDGIWQVTRIEAPDEAQEDNPMLEMMLGMLQFKIDAEKPALSMFAGGREVHSAPLKLVSRAGEKFVCESAGEKIQFELKEKDVLTLSKEGEPKITWLQRTR